MSAKIIVHIGASENACGACPFADAWGFCRAFGGRLRPVQDSGQRWDWWRLEECREAERQASEAE